MTDEVKFTSELQNSCAALKFNILDDGAIKLEEGNPVAFRYDKTPIFFGYIFSIDKKSGENKLSLTCYDQLRYFKNKDSFVYSSTYSQLLRSIASKYQLQTGEIEETGFIIPTRVEENTLFDICAYAADITLIKTGELFVLYDDFGRITLKNMSNMLLPILIDQDVFGEYTYTTSIDNDVYNRIVLARDNSKTGVRELYVANDSANQTKWGVLQYYEKCGEEDSDVLLTEKAEALLKYYNQKQKKLSIHNWFGHTGVRGGSGMVVKIDTGFEKVQNYMICEKVEHSFSQNSHLMKLDLIGGGFPG